MGTHTPRRRDGEGETALPFACSAAAGRARRDLGEGGSKTVNLSPLSTLSPQLSTSAAGAHVREVHDDFHGDLLEISMGPHHPSTHGVFRMQVTLDGETI